MRVVGGCLGDSPFSLCMWVATRMVQSAWQYGCDLCPRSFVDAGVMRMRHIPGSELGEHDCSPWLPSMSALLPCPVDSTSWVIAESTHVSRIHMRCRGCSPPALLYPVSSFMVHGVVAGSWRYSLLHSSRCPRGTHRSRPCCLSQLYPRLPLPAVVPYSGATDYVLSTKPYEASGLRECVDAASAAPCILCVSSATSQPIARD